MDRSIAPSMNAHADSKQSMVSSCSVQTFLSVRISSIPKRILVRKYDISRHFSTRKYDISLVDR